MTPHEQWLSVYFGQRPGETLLEAMRRRMNEPTPMLRWGEPRPTQARVNHDPGDEDRS